METRKITLHCNLGSNGINCDIQIWCKRDEKEKYQIGNFSLYNKYITLILTVFVTLLFIHIHLYTKRKRL